MTMRRRTCLQAGLAAMAGTLAGMPALAWADDSFPRRAIKLVVAFPAGGPTDITMRQLAENASKILGQPIIVENRPGASGSLPASQLQSTPADGYTIAQLPMSVMRLPFTTGLKWNPVEDLSYILNVTGYAFCMVASTQSGLKSWDDVVAWAKANPGKLTIGNTGTYTSPHVTSAIIAQAGGLQGGRRYQRRDSLCGRRAHGGAERLDRKAPAHLAQYPHADGAGPAYDPVFAVWPGRPQGHVCQRAGQAA